MADAHKNFAYSLVATAPSPPISGTSLVVTGGQGALFPTVPFNATVWPAGAQPTSTNSEIVRVTVIATDTFTITRAQEGSNARIILVGDQIAATMTDKVLVDDENIMKIWSPYVLASTGQGVQSLASASGQSSTGSLFVFPFTVPQNIRFNQIVLANQLSYVTSANAGPLNNSYYSKFGIYSMNANTLSLITSSSFSIGETLASVSLTWNYPVSTHTSGYLYGSFPFGNLTTSAQISSYVSGTRPIGLQFGSEMNLTGGIYWLGLMSQRSTNATSTQGLSNVGIVGMPINSVNLVGSVSGPLPIGIAGSQWTSKNTHITGWWGRHVIGFVTATSITNQGGSAIPPAITLSALGGVAAASTATILPTVTFVST